MRRVLIGHNSELFARAVARKIGGGFDVRVCTDGEKIGPLADSFRPDILILHGTMPRMDTFTILSRCPVRPQLLMVTVNYLSSDIEWKLRALGVHRILLMPTADELVKTMRSSMPQEGEEGCESDAYRVRQYLLALNFDTRLDGFRLICGAVPMLREDPNQTLSKHVYPALAKIHGLSDQRAVERSIRNSIEKAWNHRNENVWLRFFPPDAAGKIPCPSNRKLLTGMVQWLEFKE